jgi:photosystem II stability/assembly factor-like uncharacterized protein
MRIVDKFVATVALGVCAVNVSAQWVIQNSNSTADLRGIHSVDGKVAWASGTNGTVLRTVDGGEHWLACAVPPGAEKLDFRGIQAFDAETAIVMSSGKGDFSRLYKTVDGCATWKLVFTNPDKDGFWDAINIKFPKDDGLGHPLDGSHGWGYVLGDPVGGTFALFATSDGGESWNRRVAQRRGPKGEGCKIDDFRAETNEAAFAASNQSLLVLNGSYFVLVTGGGIARLGYNEVFSLDGALCHDSSHFLKLPLAGGSTSAGAFAAAALFRYPIRSDFPDKLVIVGGDYKVPDSGAGTEVTVSHLGDHLSETTNAAQTPPHGYRSAVAWDEAAKVWITVGPNGTDVSADDGRNWRALKPDVGRGEAADADRNWNALSLPFVVGPKGRIGKWDEGLGVRN